MNAILIGNKCDVDGSTDQGIRLAQELGISTYLDVRARSGQDIDDAFCSSRVKAIRLLLTISTVQP